LNLAETDKEANTRERERERERERTNNNELKGRKEFHDGREFRPWKFGRKRKGI